MAGLQQLQEYIEDKQIDLQNNYEQERKAIFSALKEPTQE